MGETRIIIKNIPTYVKEERLTEFVTGLVPTPVTDVRIIRDSQGKSRRFAFIGFNNDASAQTAVNSLNRVFLDTARLSVTFAHAPSSKDLPRAWSKHTPGTSAYAARVSKHTPGASDHAAVATSKCKRTSEASALDDEATISKINATARLLLLNLPYSMTDETLQSSLSKFGDIADVHICHDSLSGKSTGRAFVSFKDAANAVAAYKGLIGSVLFGRLVRLLPADAPLESLPTKVAKKAASSSFKRQQEEKIKSGATSSVERWNLLYVSANAAAEAAALADGVNKRQLLGVGEDGLPIINETENTLAASVALNEARIVQQTREWLNKNCVNLKAFERMGLRLLEDEKLVEERKTIPRSSDTIIVKHLNPSNVKETDIFNLFLKYGKLVRSSLAPSGTVALVQFLEPARAKAAFTALAYSRFKSAPLYLEWAPSDVYTAPKPVTELSAPPSAAMDTETDETEALKKLLDADDIAKTQHVSLHVSNVSFESTAADIEQLFGSDVEGFIQYKPITRTKKSKSESAQLNAGYGFAEFNSLKAATAALKRFQGVVLHGHALKLKLSDHSPGVAVATSSNEMMSDDLRNITPKLTVRNLAFQATSRDLRGLFDAFGSVVGVRIPKKSDGTSRGYGFVEFASRSEAIAAFQALQNTHLYGRRLVSSVSFNNNYVGGK